MPIAYDMRTTATATTLKMNLKQKYNLKLLAICLAMRRPSPELIPLSGEDRIKSRNYNTVYLTDKYQEPTCYVISIKNNFAVAKWYNDVGQDPAEVCIPSRVMADFGIEIHSYLRSSEIHFRNSLVYMIFLFARIQNILLFIDAFAQFFYNRRPLIFRQRTEVLKIVYNNYIAGANDLPGGFGVTNLCNNMFGSRFWKHPQKESIQKHYALILDSLVRTGDLEYGSFSTVYKLTPEGYKTLESTIIEERRISLQNSLQTTLVILTLCMTAATIVQACVAYLSL